MRAAKAKLIRGVDPIAPELEEHAGTRALRAGFRAQSRLERLTERIPTPAARRELAILRGEVRTMHEYIAGAIAPRHCPR